MAGKIKALFEELQKNDAGVKAAVETIRAGGIKALLANKELKERFVHTFCAALKAYQKKRGYTDEQIVDFGSKKLDSMFQFPQPLELFDRQAFAALIKAGLKRIEAEAKEGDSAIVAQIETLLEAVA